jgi:hypothetical protein
MKGIQNIYGIHTYGSVSTNKNEQLKSSLRKYRVRTLSLSDNELQLSGSSTLVEG